MQRGNENDIAQSEQRQNISTSEQTDIHAVSAQPISFKCQTTGDGLVNFLLKKNILGFCFLLLVSEQTLLAAGASEFDPFATEVPPEKAGSSAQKGTRQDGGRAAVKPTPPAVAPAVKPTPVRSSPVRVPNDRMGETSRENDPPVPAGAAKKAPPASKKGEEFDPFATDQPPEKWGLPRKEPMDGSSELGSGKSTEKIGKKSRQEKAPPERSHLQPGLALKLDGSLESVFSVSYAVPLLPFAKLSNDQILIPHLMVSEQVYPVFKISAGRGFLLNARPRFSLLNERSKDSAGSAQFENAIRADAGEIFATWTPSSRFSLTVGKQNFQWGVAEMAGPSNWIFRSQKNADTLLRTPQSEVDTRDAMRFNFSWGQSFNVVLMAEYEPEKQSLPRDFSGRRVFLKPEISWNAGADFFGVVIGGAERKSEPFFGEYFLFNLTDSLSLFADFSHKKGSDALRPLALSKLSSSAVLLAQIPALPFEQSRITSSKYTHEGVLGLKYNFANGAEVRLEAYYNSAGLSAEEIDAVEKLELDSSPFTPLFFDLGQEYRSQGAILFAARPVGFDSKRNWNLFGRYLKPIIDPVGAFMLYSEYAVSDSAVLFLGFAGTHGRKISEVALPFRTAVTVGQKYVW